MNSEKPLKEKDLPRPAAESHKPVWREDAEKVAAHTSRERQASREARCPPLYVRSQGLAKGKRFTPCSGTLNTHSLSWRT